MVEPLHGRIPLIPAQVLSNHILIRLHIEFDTIVEHLKLECVEENKGPRHDEQQARLHVGLTRSTSRDRGVRLDELDLAELGTSEVEGEDAAGRLDLRHKCIVTCLPVDLVLHSESKERSLKIDCGSAYVNLTFVTVVERRRKGKRGGEYRGGEGREREEKGKGGTGRKKEMERDSESTRLK